MAMVPYESLESSDQRNILLQPPTYDISKALRQELHREQTMTQEIRASFYNKTPSLDHKETPLPFNRHFLVVHFGDYLTNHEGSHPAEFAIADFSIRDGISYCFSRMIDPGTIPFGYHGDYRDMCKLRGYELPGFDAEMDFGVDCLDVIENLMGKYVTDDDPHGTLYTIRGNVAITTQSLKYIAEREGRSFNFKVFPLSRLVELLFLEGEHLRSLNRIDSSSIVYSEENALALLMGGDYDAFAELGCHFHTLPSKLETLEHCSLTLVKRWVYNCLNLLTKLYCCPMYAHTHVPKLDPTPSFEEELPIDSPSGSTPGLWSSTTVGVRETPETATGSSSRVPPSPRERNQTGSARRGSGIPGSMNPRGRPMSPRGHSWFAGNATPRERNQSVSTRRGSVTPTSPLARDPYQSSSDTDIGSSRGITRPIPSSRTSGSGSMTSGAQEIDIICQVPTPAPRVKHEKPEREITKADLVTIQVFPQLNADLHFDPAERAMRIFRMPDMKQRQFPPMTDRIELFQVVPGRTSNRPNPAHPKPPTIFRLEDPELVPISFDFSFRSRMKGSPSVAGSASSYDTYFSSVSKTAPLPDTRVTADPMVRDQAYRLLYDGVLPQTKFVETGIRFWDTDPIRVGQGPRGRGRPRLPQPPEPVVGHVLGRAPNQHMPEVLRVALEPAVPADEPHPQPMRGGRGRGRGAALLGDQLNPAMQPQGFPPAGLDDDGDADRSGSLSLVDDVFFQN